MLASVLTLCCFASSTPVPLDQAVSPSAPPCPAELIRRPKAPPETDPLDDMARFPCLDDVQVWIAALEADRGYAVRMLLVPEEGGPYVDYPQQPAWTAYYTAARDDADARLDCWRELRVAQIAMYPDHCYPSTDRSLQWLRQNPIQEYEWVWWKKSARASMRRLRGLLGNDAYLLGKMP